MNKLFPMVVSVGVAMLTGVAAADYQLVEGVYTISVAQGQTQTNLTDDDKAALKDAACVELVKDGEGTLKLTSNSVISAFKGKITIAKGIYYVNNANGVEGYLGTGDGATEVRNGATILFTNYLADGYKNEEITISGTGFGGMGVIHHPDVDAGQIALNFKKLTLADDATVLTLNSSRGFSLNGALVDLGGHTLTLEGTKQGVMGINPKEISNPGNIYIKTDNWVIPARAPLLGGGDHVLTLDMTTAVKANGIVHTNLSTWTLCIKNDNTTLRVYTPPFDWDGPLRVPESGTFKVEVNKNITQSDPDLCFARFNGPIYGGATISCGGDDETASIFGCATNAQTFTGKFTWTAANRRHSIVSMVPGAVPDMFGAGVTGLNNNYQNGLGIGLQTETNPNGYDCDAITNAWEECFQNRNETLVMYVEKGQTFRGDFTMDENFNYYWRNSSNLRTGALGGDVILNGLYDKCGLFRNLIGTHLFFSGQERESGVNTIDNFNIDGGLVTLRDMGYFTAKSTTCGDLTANERAELRVDSGTVMGEGTYGISVGARNSGAGGRLSIVSGAIVSNKVAVAAAAGNNNCNGEVLLDGGVLYSPSDSNIGGSTNSCGTMTVVSGELTMTKSLNVAATAPSSVGIYRQFGGTAEFGDPANPGLKYLCCGAGTSAVHVAGGTFTFHGKAFLPRPISATDACVGGHADFAVTAGSALVGSGCYLCGRSDSVGSVSVSGEGVLATTAIAKQRTNTYDETKPVTGGYASACFDGGTLKAVENGELFGTGETALDAVHVRAGGMAVDTDGKDAAISVPLTQVPTEGGITALTILNDKGAVSTLTNFKSCPAVLIFGDGHGASAVAEYDEETFTVTGVKIVNPGWGYTAANTKAYVFQYGSRAKSELQVTIGANAASGDFVKRGAGTLTLGAANTYAGSTVVEGGTLKFGVAGALPEGSAIVSRGGAVAAADYADVPKEIAFDVADPDPKAKIVLARWDTCTVGEPTASDFTVTGLPDEWQVAVRGNTLVASKPRGTLLLIK